jgi:hypothetical protein
MSKDGKVAMVTEQVQRLRGNDVRPGIRLEVVDNLHEKWPEVSAWIQQSGQAGRVLDEDGWLSARQVVVAAFVGPKVVGHLGFRVAPERSGGKIVLEARIDSLHVEEPGVEQLLFDRAQAQARLLGCRSLKRTQNDER